MKRLIIVQQIHSIWTKASRGGKGAEQRNAVPETAPVPLQSMDGSTFTIAHHKLTYREHMGFAQPFEEAIEGVSDNLVNVGCVSITQGTSTVDATYRYGRKCGGAPEREWARKTLCIAPNEWGQIIYNGRFAPGWDGDWWYEKMVVNICMSNQPSNDVFERSDPTYRFTNMAQLL